MNDKNLELIKFGVSAGRGELIVELIDYALTKKGEEKEFLYKMIMEVNK